MAGRGWGFWCLVFELWCCTRIVVERARGVFCRLYHMSGRFWVLGVVFVLLFRFFSFSLFRISLLFSFLSLQFSVTLLVQLIMLVLGWGFEKKYTLFYFNRLRVP